MHRIDLPEEFQEKQRKPHWLKVKAPGGVNFSNIRTMMRSKSLHTVCEEAHCPNINECWNNGTATFLILGNICTRSCGFCAIITGKPTELDWNEPRRVAESVKTMGVKHAVITSVNRDELKDGGSTIWAETIRAIRELNSDVTIEVLIPDFKGDFEALRRVIDAKPDVLNHNVETIPRLYPKVRPQAKYQRSLDILKESKRMGMHTKTGMMVGLSETKKEVLEVMDDLISINIDIMTIGQYLQPTKEHLPVARYVHPDEFEEYRNIGLQKGFKIVESGPLVRSSYHAEKHLRV